NAGSGLKNKFTFVRGSEAVDFGCGDLAADAVFGREFTKPGRGAIVGGDDEAALHIDAGDLIALGGKLEIDGSVGLFEAVIADEDEAAIAGEGGEHIAQ